MSEAHSVDPRVSHQQYKCSACQQPRARDSLTAKRVYFTTMGRGFKTIRSRTVAWLCPDCLEKDDAWTADMYSDSPGMVNTKLAEKP